MIDWLLGREDIFLYTIPNVGYSFNATEILSYRHLEENLISMIERGAFQDLKQLERL